MTSLDERVAVALERIADALEGIELALAPEAEYDSTNLYLRLAELAEPEPEPVKRKYVRVRPEQARDWFVAQGSARFTIHDYCDHFGCSVSPATTMFQWAKARGIIVLVEESRRIGFGERTPNVWVYAKPTRSGLPPLPRGSSTDTRGCQAVAGTGSKKLTTDKETRDLVSKAKAQGADVRETSDGHIHVRGPKGQVSLSKTPKGGRSKTHANNVAALRRAGLDV